MPPPHSFPPGQPHPLPINIIDSTLGALLVGVLLSYVLFGVTTTQTYLYSGRFPNDSRKLKLLVACVWFLELGHVICIGHTLYTMVITNFGHPDLEHLTTIPQSLGASTLLNALLAMCVQGFFSFRIYRLWKRLYIPLLTWALSFIFLGATSAVFVVGLESMPFPMFEKQWGFLLNTLWAVAAANDLIIALTLVFWLVRKREDSEQMTPVVDKVIGWTIETGVITRHVLYFLLCLRTTSLTLYFSAAAILNLVCFVTMKNNFIWIAWYVVTARLYSNSFLASLNSRGTLRTMTQISISKPYPLFSSNFSVNNQMPDAFLSMRTPMSEMSRTVSVDSGNPYMMR